MNEEQAVPEAPWAAASDRSAAVRRLDRINFHLPVALLRKHYRAFFRGAHPGKS